ncbi:MAG: cation-transporting P-type ATPase [Desulfobulbaceae bacterium]|uniref:Cation-transporting P-type ATPase n=1 Tax=Candidatus Desulfobia pelagia TaxID=2841692 RepID=A0A8J6NC02_9BACT|nr:cation-transporting P-type ATPase [Candidatus Desulfobia pelagia]
MTTLIGKHWHHLPAEEVVDLLDSDVEKGLDHFEIKHLQETFGPNALTAKKGKGPFKRFLLQFHQPLIYILIVSGSITALLQEWVDSGVIFGVVLVNAIIGYIQEAKAVNALAALARTMTTEATVLRQGEKKQIPATELVPGDIVLLASGDKVPADLRLLEVKDLRIDESALTGESLPVEKKGGELNPDTLLADRLNMSYASSLVTYGQGTGIVTATGDHTEVGRISELIASADELATPLTRKIAHFSHILLYAILALTVLTVAVGILRGQAPFDMFMAAVALAVGAIPEGLPAAVTITLAIGVSRMAKQRAIIRKLPAVETLGSTTVICSDKTGTLTENQMTVQKIIAGDIAYEVTGAGYNPLVGKILREGNSFDLAKAPALVECLYAGILCNDSQLLNKDKTWYIQGDPTEGALFVPAIKGGIDLAEQKNRFPRLDVLPFESEHQYMATLHTSEGNSKQRIYIKGAVEAVLARCSNQLDSGGGGSALDANKIISQVEHMAKMGLRVLAFAQKERAAADGITHDDVRSDLVFIGLMAMIDPPRAEAIQAIKVCQNAGISVKMITGDHAVTAAAIARQIGLNGMKAVHGDSPRVLTGSDLAALSDRELIEEAEKTAVFARVAPEQKLRLVEALQSRGHVVAMTGDGVNDAPALKQADIGVAMGITGTEVSKEAADMVLTDDNFSSIEAAVEEGRGVFDNLTKFIVWTLPTNLGEGLVIMTAVFFGATLPILPVQILWINMTTAGFLGLMLAFEPKEPGIMTRLPRNPKTPILTKTLIGRILLVGGLLLGASFALFQWELARGADVAQARTVAVNVFVVMELFYLFNCRSLTKSVFQLGFFSNMWVFGGVAVMLLLQLAYTYFPVMNRLFQSAPIGLGAWVNIVAAGIVAFAIVEFEKGLRARFPGKSDKDLRSTLVRI